MNRRTAKQTKAMIRELEDRRDARMILNTQQELARREIEMMKELEEGEKKHNVYMKKQFQEMKENNTKKEEVVNCVTALRFSPKKDTLSRMYSFAAVQVDNFKRSVAVKKSTLAKRFETAIEDYARSRPLVMDLHNKEILIERLKSILAVTLAEQNRFRKFKNDETQIANILLKQNITEMAEHVLRYYMVVDKVKNPKKRMVSSAHAKVMAKMAMKNRKKQKPSSSVPEPMLIDDDMKMVPETTVTSKCQDTIDTNEVGDDQEFKRGSRVRSAFRARKSDEAEKDKSTPVHSKPAVPTQSSLKAPANAKNSLQPKGKKGSVRFENYPPPGSGFKKNFIEDHRVSSSGFTPPSDDNDQGIPNHVDDAIDPPADDNEIDFETDPPLDEDEFGTPLDGNENDAPFDDNELDPLFGDADDMGSHEIEPQMDDDEQNSIDDSISDWTSLDPSSGNKDDAATSQVSFDDLDEMTVDMRFFAGSHSKTEPSNKDNFGQSGADGDFQLSDGEDFGEDDDFFKKF